MNHWPRFAAFCKAELDTGGPDPQIDLLVELARGHSPLSQWWLAGCYAAHHCVPSAYAVWSRLPISVNRMTQNDVEALLRKLWKHLPVRNEMRSHRMPEKRAACLVSAAQFARTHARDNGTFWHSYEDAWDAANDQIVYFGRYMAIKYLEILYRMTGEERFRLPDLRARGAWSPRRTLAMLWPKVRVLGYEDQNDAPDLVIVDTMAKKTRHHLRAKYGVKVSMFQLQVLLCEYREALNGSYYPGASHDEEMPFIRTVEQRTVCRAVWRARKTLFPHDVLGEVEGWDGPRKAMQQPFKLEGRH